MAAVNPYNLLDEIINDATVLMEHANAGGIRQGAVELMFDAEQLKTAHAYIRTLTVDVEDEIRDRAFNLFSASEY